MNYEPIIGDFQNASIFPDNFKRSWRVAAVFKNMMEDDTMVIPPPRNQLYEGPELFPTVLDNFGEIFARPKRKTG